ncbi:MAG: hypothetical protein IMW97_05355 [Firmicutes bacterium]|nr:hypothetical protein [Candidatus Fermentithermobacillaceae bacterium]
MFRTGSKRPRGQRGSSLIEAALALALGALILEILASWLVFSWAVYRRDLLRESIVLECRRMIEELRSRPFDALLVGTGFPWAPEDPALSELSGIYDVRETGPGEKMIRVSLRKPDGSEVYSLVTWVVSGITR